MKASAFLVIILALGLSGCTTLRQAFKNLKNNTPSNTVAIKMSWHNRDTNMSGMMASTTLTSGTIRLNPDKNGVSCRGKYEFSIDDNFWTISCTDNTSAAGRFRETIPALPHDAIGEDQNSNQVSFQTVRNPS